MFGPHSAAFRLEKDGSGDGGLLTVRHCSVLLPPRRSSVFEVPGNGTGKLDVAYSLFSRMAGDDDPEGAVLLRLAEAKTDATWKGRDNRYHDLDGYWAVGSDKLDWQRAGWSDFRSRLGKGRGQDESRVLMFSPWKSGSSLQVSLLEGREWQTAFRTWYELSALRVQERSTTEVVGAERILGQRLVPEDLPRPEQQPGPAVRRSLVVEKQDDSSNGFYSSLAAAVASARPGDTILIRHNGELAVAPVHLNTQGLSDLTIRPVRRFRPSSCSTRRTCPIPKLRCSAPTRGD